MQLKLWNVNKNFYRATKEVIPYQLKNSQARIEELQDEAKMVQENKAFELERDMPDLEARQKMMLSKGNAQSLKQSSTPPE